MTLYSVFSNETAGKPETVVSTLIAVGRPIENDQIACHDSLLKKLADSSYSLAFLNPAATRSL